MLRSHRLALLLLACALSAAAQTYIPKSIRLQGADGMDHAEIMRLVDLKPGAPITREQIEAAMQRLADSGLFADLSYKVDPNALVFVLEPIAGAQAQSVRFANFVWWRPGELEPLVEARVPLFRGKLPLTGQLTAQVETALSALLAEKGVPNARVEAMQSTLGGSGIALTITQPPITLGDVRLTGIAPDTVDQINRIASRLAASEFDSAETPNTIVNNTLDTHRNAGYLDATVDPPVFAPPHPQGKGYAVDATATVHAGPLYRIAAINFIGVDPKLEPEVAKATGIKVGDPAGQMTVRIAAGLTTRTLANRGNLEAKTTARVVKDDAAHTAAYTFTLVPGPVYTFAAVDTSALSTDAQSRFAAAFSAKPGVVADMALRADILHALGAAGVTRTAAAQARLDRSAHTVTYVINSKAAVNANSDSPEESRP